MKRFLIVAVAALAAVAWASPRKAVEEDFEGSQFPPPGWKKSGTRTWYWKNPGGYAEGYGACWPYPDESWTALETPLFRVNRGTALRIEFRYRAHTGGLTEATYHLIIDGWLWKEILPTYVEWAEFDQFTQPSAIGGEYRVEFRISLAGGSYGCWGYWYLDDVLITRDNVAVVPASVGRVKALFK